MTKKQIELSAQDISALEKPANRARLVKAPEHFISQELITDIQGNIKKVVMDFQDYLRLLEAIEDEGLILAMKEVENETPLHLNEALAKLEKE
jgi:hypothetical protein